ncbi:hypothetical protein [uncultured Microbacterium sp.]|uniref:hypothetical protein n=1 Tax=uncultured Microbacterium sp. TaxID=191216 RepID=UPI0028E34F12|nr:hypothetical protein [uncultured Microbacterium sp.]
MIALLPKFRLEDATDPALARDVVSMFPRIVTDNSSEATNTRTHIWSLRMNERGGGTLSIGRAEVPVAVLPLDISTPPEMSVFTVVSITGRLIQIRGVTEEPA